MDSNSFLEQSMSDKNESITSVDSHFDTMHHQNHQYHGHVKRESSHRIFVNRSFQLSDIKFYGFDMDHTLAVYKTDSFDLLTFKLATERLITLGYPEDIKNFVYDPKFAVRGLWYDKLYGNLLKVDPYGNILICTHGFKILKGQELYKYYPNKFINYDENRIAIQHTLYEHPESYLLACVVNYFSTNKNYTCEPTGVTNGTVFISYKAIYQDVNDSIDYQYITNTIQKQVTENIEKFIVKDEKLALLLSRIKENNAKAFLLTNANYDYADKVMGYMLNNIEPGRNWRSYFDYILVDAKKPLFFTEGTCLKEINIETHAKNIGTHSGPLLSNRVYSGGNVEVFSKLINSHGKDVLYVGDHIFGDIIKSKKVRAWHTFLIVPELSKELSVYSEIYDLYSQMNYLNEELSHILINYDSSSKNCPDISKIKEKINNLIHQIDMSYSYFGSIFRTGSRQTYFASQVTRYADIYSSTCLNLLHYPFFYLFKAAPQLMPHESTVNPEDPFIEQNDHRINRSTSITKGNITLSNSEIVAKTVDLNRYKKDAN